MLLLFVVLRYLLVCDSESLSSLHMYSMSLKVNFGHVFARMARFFNILTEFGIFTIHTTDEIFETLVAVL